MWNKRLRLSPLSPLVINRDFYSSCDDIPVELYLTRKLAQ